MVLIRHGRVDADRLIEGGSGGASVVAKRCIGWTDLELCAPQETRAQMLAHAAELMERGERTWRIVSSDLRRAVQTADILAAALGIACVERDERLRELHFGRWEGMTWPEIEAADPLEYAAFMDEWRVRPTPGGESYAMLRARVEAFCKGVDEDEALIVVAHHGSLRALRGALLGLDEEASMGHSWAYGGLSRVC